MLKHCLKLTESPDVVALSVPCGTNSLETITFSSLAFGSSLLVDINRAGAVETVANLGDVTFRSCLSAGGSFLAQLRENSLYSNHLNNFLLYNM